MPGGVAGAQFIRTAPYADCALFLHAAGFVEADLSAVPAFTFLSVVVALLSIQTVWQANAASREAKGPAFGWPSTITSQHAI